MLTSRPASGIQLGQKAVSVGLSAAQTGGNVTSRAFPADGEQTFSATDDWEEDL